MDYYLESLKLHAKHHGKIELTSKIPVQTKDDLSLAYSPGVAEPCREIAKNPEKSFDLTWRGNVVAVISDGTAVLGLGDIGPEAALPVMEGKALLFKEFGGVDAIPLCLNTKNVDEIVETIVRLAPSFGGINLEDISAPRCFEIEEKLKQKLNIPVFHDDQHGTAIVVLAALKNALKVVGKNLETVKIIISGSGAAGIAVAKLILHAGGKNIVITDSKGVIGSHRTDLNFAKQEVLSASNLDGSGTLLDVLKNADVFIGLSQPNLIKAEDIQTMNSDAIIFAMANPTPEIMPEEAKKGGARIIATGRSDFPNQVNNVLVFPGLFKGVFAIRAKNITEQMMIAASEALSNAINNPSEENIIPSPLQKGIADLVANAIINL